MTAESLDDLVSAYGNAMHFQGEDGDEDASLADDSDKARKDLLDAIVALRARAEKAEGDLKVARELVYAKTGDLIKNGKTVVDFYQVWLDQARAAERKAEAEVVALREDAERYRWLRPRLFSTDWEYGSPPTAVITFQWPNAPVGVGDALDSAIDSARLAEKDKGG